MIHFLDTLPLDFGLPATRELQELLASTYYKEDLIVALLRVTPLRPSDVNLNGSARQIWFSVLDTARNQKALRPLVNAAAQDKPAIKERIGELLAAEPVVASPDEPTGGAGEPQEKPWVGPGDVDGIERLLSGASTLLDVAFLDRGVRTSRAVARLRTTFEGQAYHGTAFRIGKDLLLTNHHVLHDWEHDDQEARKVDVWFDYELDATGDLKAVCALAGDPATIAGEKKHDWSVIRTEGAIPDRYPALSLAPKLPTTKNDRVYIVQHPNGMPKQIGMHRNLVSYVDDDVIQYLTDTQKGSSGSPVFNERWEVAALHHRWVEVKELRDGTEIVAYRNQGRRIERVVEGLRNAGINLG